MTTFGELARQQEDALFVGREAELAALVAWLDGGRTLLFNLTGPGGVGKSTLLRRFEAIASNRGYEVSHVDGADIGASPTGLLDGLGLSDLDEVSARLSSGKHLVAIDSYEAIDSLTPYVRDELIPSLPTSVRVLIAGRDRLDPQRWSAWVAQVDARRLKPLSPNESRDFLSRAGVPQGTLMEAIVQATHGMPLGLAIGSQLVARGAHESISLGDWHAVLRDLLNHAFAQLGDPAVRTVAEAACIVRRFDEDLIAGMLPETAVGEAFDRLVAMSFVERRRHGFALHEEVRGLLETDLRLSEPTRHQELRARAGQIYTARLEAGRSTAEREWLMLDGLALQQGVGPSLPAPALASRVEPYVPADRSAVLKVNAEFVALHPAAATMTADERDPATVARILDWPLAEVVVARSSRGDVHGYGFVLPMATDTLEVLGRGSQIGDAYLRWARSARRPVARTASESRTWFSSTICYGRDDPREAETALGEYGLTLLRRDGVFLMATSLPLYEQLVLAVGGRVVGDLPPGVDGGDALHLIELDIAAYGLDAWTAAVLTGKPPVRRFAGPPLRDAVRDVLAHWHDSAALAASVLAVSIDPPRTLGADEVRARVLAVMDRPVPDATRQALDAVRYAYVDRVSSIEAAADRLHVSRATLFRLLARGTEEIAGALEIET